MSDKNNDDGAPPPAYTDEETHAAVGLPAYVAEAAAANADPSSNSEENIRRWDSRKQPSATVSEISGDRASRMYGHYPTLE